MAQTAHYHRQSIQFGRGDREWDRWAKWPENYHICGVPVSCNCSPSLPKAYLGTLVSRSAESPVDTSLSCTHIFPCPTTRTIPYDKMMCFTRTSINQKLVYLCCGFRKPDECLSLRDKYPWSSRQYQWFETQTFPHVKRVY